MTKAARVQEPQLFGHSCFVILSTFDLRHCPEPPHVGCYKSTNHIKFDFRQLLKNLAFRVMAVLIALAIGVNAASKATDDGLATNRLLDILQGMVEQ